MAAEAADKRISQLRGQKAWLSQNASCGEGRDNLIACELSTARVYGGVNGNYGSGILEWSKPVTLGKNESEIAETYINNMGAVYGSEEDWEKCTTMRLRPLSHTHRCGGATPEQQWERSASTI